MSMSSALEPRSRLEPRTAVAYLSELSADVRAVAVLGRGEILASGLRCDRGGRFARAMESRFQRFDIAMGSLTGVRIAVAGTKVFARRGPAHTLMVVASPLALDELLWHDLGVILADLAGRQIQHAQPQARKHSTGIRLLDSAATTDRQLVAAARALADVGGRRKPDLPRQ